MSRVRGSGSRAAARAADTAPASRLKPPNGSSSPVKTIGWPVRSVRTSALAYWRGERRDEPDDRELARVERSIADQQHSAGDDDAGLIGHAAQERPHSVAALP